MIRVDKDILIYWRSKWFIWKYLDIQTLNASNAKFDDVLVDSPFKVVGTGDFKPLDYGLPKA